MSKKWNRFLSFLLAIALVVTTFGSDFASANVYATEGEEAEVIETPAEAEALPEIFEEVADESAEEITEDVYTEETTDVVPVEEGSVEEPAVTEEPAAPASEDAAAEEPATEETSDEDAAAEASSEEEEDAAAEASSEEEEDAAAEASSEEVKKVEKAFQHDVTIDNINIALYADPGVLPADAELVVEKVSVQKSTEIADAIEDQYASAEEVETYSFDISIWSPSEEKFVQPEDGTVEVRFSEIEQAADENVALAVHHVSDDLDKIEPVAELSKESKETEISFDTTHFSIYSISIIRYGWFEDKDYNFTVQLIDVNGNSVGSDLTFNGYTYGRSFNVSQIIPSIQDYSVVGAYYCTDNDQFVNDIKRLSLNVLDLPIAKFALPVHSLVLNTDDGHVYAHHALMPIAWGKIAGDEGQLVFVYRKKGIDYDLSKTDDHLDLGLSYADFMMYKTGGATVTAVVNGTEYNMTAEGQDTEMGTYEYRMWLGNYKYPSQYSGNYSGLDTVKTSDTISFKVNYKNQIYVYDCSQADNETASNACYAAHKVLNQKAYGFDYKLKFTEVFNLTGDIVYHANCDATPNGLGAIASTVSFDSGENEKDVKVKDYASVSLGYGNKAQYLYTNNTDSFLGWATEPEAKVAEYKPGSYVKAKRGEQVDLYAVWKKHNLTVTTDHIDLGFKKADFEMYKNGGAKVSVYVNGTEYTMWPKDLDAQIGTYEYRLYLATYEKSLPKQYSGLKSVSVEDTIVFKVDYAGQEYVYECSTEDNMDASTRCYEAHKKIQSIFGFDYILDIHEEFKLTGDVIYHANFNVPLDELSQISETIRFKYGETQKDYSIKSEYEDVQTDSTPAKKLAVNTGFKFLGWSLNPQAEEPEYKKGEANTITVVKETTTDLYAIWEEDLEPAYYQVEYYYQDNNGQYDEDNPTDISELRSKNVPIAGMEVSVEPEDKIPAKNIYTFHESKSHLTDTLQRSNTEKNPLILKVYFSRNITGVVMDITAPSDSKIFDGTALTISNETAPSVAVNKEGLAANYTVSVEYEGSRTDIGNAENKIKSYTVTNTVTGEVYYYEVEGHTNSVDETGKVLDKDAELMQINLAPGQLTVTPLAVEITIPDAEKVYDGTFYDAADYTGTLEVVVKNEATTKPSVKLSDTVIEIPKTVITVAQSADKKDEISLKTGYKVAVNDKEVAAENLTNGNIVVTVKNGDLKITRRTVIIKSGSKERVLDGKALFEKSVKVITPDDEEIYADTYDFVKGEAPKYDNFKVIYKGEADNTFTYQFADDLEENESIANNYIVVVRYGKLKLTPPEKKWKIIVSLHADGEGSGNEKKVRYDGDEHHADLAVTLHIQSEETEKEVPDEDQNNTTPTTPTTPTSFFRNIFSSLGSLFTLKVFAYEPVPEQTIVHDGTTFYVRGLYVDGGVGEEVGRYPVTLDYTDMAIYVMDEKGDLVNVTGDLIDKEPEIKKAPVTTGEGDNDVTVDDVQPERKTEEIGGLTIIKREVTLTSASASKTYDGAPLYNHSTPKQSWPKDGELPQTYGIVDGHKYTIKNTTQLIGNRNTRTQTANVFEFEFEDSNIAKNYDIKKVYGTLTVDPVPSENVTPPPTQETTILTPPGQVLGAQRESGAVLGARRGGTEDPTNNAARVIVIVIAAGIAISIMFFGRKKEDREEE